MPSPSERHPLTQVVQSTVQWGAYAPYGEGTPTAAGWPDGAGGWSCHLEWGDDRVRGGLMSGWYAYDPQPDDRQPAGPVPPEPPAGQS